MLTRDIASIRKRSFVTRVRPTKTTLRATLRLIPTDECCSNRRYFACRRSHLRAKDEGECTNSPSFEQNLH